MALPLAEWLYRRLRPEASRTERHVTREKTRPTIDLGDAASRTAIVCALIWTGNLVATQSAGLRSALGVPVLYAVVLTGMFLAKRAPFYLPSVAWISFVGIVLTLPFMPGGTALASVVSTIDVLPAATPCLAYAGLALAERDMVTFRRAGWRLGVVSILVFAGTYLGLGRDSGARSTGARSNLELSSIAQPGCSHPGTSIAASRSGRSTPCSVIH